MKIKRKVSYQRLINKPVVPFIRLSGQWLENAGFSIGREFTLTSQDNKLILEPIKESHIDGSYTSTNK